MEAPNKKWVTDIPSLPMVQGWLSLAVILDLSSRIVVGWSMSSNCDEDLVEHALLLALARRRPSVGLLHHRDRGSQSTSQAYQAHFEQSGMRVSLSRTGNCWDNAAMESFFGTLKDECVGRTVSASHEEARLSLLTSLEVYDHRIRRPSTLGYVSPFIYEQMGGQENERVRVTFSQEGF